jgi:amidohydrolase
MPADASSGPAAPVWHPGSVAQPARAKRGRSGRAQKSDGETHGASPEAPVHSPIRFSSEILGSPRRPRMVTVRSPTYASEAEGLFERLREWRIGLHEEPELSNEEWRTREKIARALTEIGLSPQTFPDFPGVVAIVGAGRPGPTVALRADMDALPVTEETGLAFASRVPGRMHACGHDIHMACLLGAGALLKRREERLAGPVKLLFQPAEEDGTVGGAVPLLERGAFERPKVDYVVGQHVAPDVPVGSVAWRRGPMMAAADHFAIRVRGSGGHAGYPHRASDVVLAASEIVVGLQALVSRMRNPVDPAVVSVGSIHGGTRRNVLPDEVVLEGTVRSFSPVTRSRLKETFLRRVAGIAGSAGVTAEVDYREGYPPVVNDPGSTDRVADALRRALGPDRVVELPEPVMGAEDFARYLERVRGTFLFLGTGRPGEPVVPKHSARFSPDERALVTGSVTLAAAAEALQAP